MSGITSEHPQYTANKLKWKLVDDVIASNVEQYILPPEYGSTRRITQRNNNYVKRAVFINYTINTRLGLVGTALLKDPKIELPPELDYLIDQATGNKLKLDQLLRKNIGEVIEKGRHILFVDYPSVPMGLSAEQVSAIKPRPYIYAKKAKEVINWGTRWVNGVEMLDFMIIREVIPTRGKDGYQWQDIVQHRCLYLDEVNHYYYDIRDEHGKSLLEDKVGGYDKTVMGVYPKQNNAFWDHIPAYFCGSEDNDPDCDDSPLYPIAHVNIGHYRNNAGLEANGEAHGTPTLAVTSSLNGEQWTTANNGRPLLLGSPEGYFLGATGSMTLCQAEPAQLLADMMDQKVEQMIGMGASIMQSANANAPVETTRMQMGAKISRLDTIVSNTEDAATLAARDCALYMGANPDLVKISMSHEFIPENADATVMREIAAQWQGGAIPVSILRAYDRKVNIIPRETTDEDLDAELEKESPLGMGQGFNDQQPNQTSKVDPNANLK